MRVLHTVRSLEADQGGPSRSVPLLANSLRNLGIDAHVWTKGPRSSLCEDLGVPELRGDLKTTLSRSAWDLCHDHGLWLSHNRTIARFCRRSGVKRVVSPRGMLEPWALAHHGWRKRLAWTLFQRADLLSSDGLHASSESEERRFRDLGFEGPIARIPNGVEVPPTDSLASFEGPPTVVFLGRVHPVKGLDVLIDAWSLAGLDGWRMEVFGPDEDGHQGVLEEKLRRAGLLEDWVFAGAVSAEGRWDALRRGHVFVLPSHSENFGLAVAEALAVGVPVITTKGTPWSGLEQRGCGRWVDLEPAKIASALVEMASSTREQLSAMGRIGSKWVRQAFSWSGAGSEMRDLYDQLWRGARR